MRDGAANQGQCAVPAATRGAASEDEGQAAAIRRLRLDVEDLRFECHRLKQALAQTQADAVARAEQNASLRRENATLLRKWNFIAQSSPWRLGRFMRRLGRKLNGSAPNAGPRPPSP